MSLKYRIGAWGDLFGHYSTVFGYWWQKRKEITPGKLRSVEAEFLPAALAIQHKPVSPTTRWAARLLILLLSAMLIWSILGHIDITVDANGKVVPDGHTKDITAIQVATVKSILVSDGQQVKAGQPLIELDASPLENEHTKDVADWQISLLQAARSRALISSLQSGKQPIMPKVTGVSEALWNEESFHLQSQWSDFVAKRDRLNADIDRYGSTLSMAKSIAEEYSVLASTDDVARTEAMAKVQAAADIRGQLDGARTQLASLVAETRKNAEDDLTQATKMSADAQSDAAKVLSQIDQLTLRSPVDGTAQELKVHTVGAAIPAAQPLMQIVPRDSSIEMEVMLADKDVGFVHVGQDAEVKIDTYDYTKYGTIPAKVSVVSRDAVEDQKKGLEYAVHVTLLHPTLNVDGTSRTLFPGMSGTVEIRTGRRRVIEYFLSPLMKHLSGSLHER